MGQPAQHNGCPSAVGGWDSFEVDQKRLLERTDFYARRCGASDDIRGAMLDMLASDAGKAILSMQREDLLGLIVNDAYKAKMHKMYAHYYSGVTADFALNVRKTKLALTELESEHPALYDELLAAIRSLSSVTPYGASTRDALQKYFAFDTDEAMQSRAKAQGVTRDIRWLHLSKGAQETQLLALASGPIESASHVETSLMQLVQEFTIRAQAHKIEAARGIRLDRTERLANSLGKLAGSVTRINDAAACAKGPPVKLALFAGRRSSDRTFLLLLNLFCAAKLSNCVGSSCIPAVECLDLIVQEHPFACVAAKDGRICNLSLIGTHAHELQSVTQQLLSCYDYKAGAGGAPVCVSSLLAHLLFLASNGGLASSTALADTFGTAAFVAASVAADVPQEFIDDIAARAPEEPPVPQGSKVFDLIKVWRIDSGDYLKVRESILAGWEQRCRETDAAGMPNPPRPVLMHSNLGTVEEVLEMISMDAETRPAALGFGTLMDGFVPFEGDFPFRENDATPGTPANLEMSSVVMKAVQAHGPPGLNEHLPPCAKCMKSASKLGDTDGKIQVDPRLGKDEAAELLEELNRMKQNLCVDAKEVSAALAEAYHAVTRARILCGGAGHQS